MGLGDCIFLQTPALPFLCPFNNLRKRGALVTPDWLITGQVASDGRSDWLKGTQLLAVYLILGLTYFFLPGQRG
jgi:hypothetical protein